MGKVSQAEHHVDLLQKEALGNLQLRMDEVGISVLVCLLLVTLCSILCISSCSQANKGCNDRVIGGQ